MAGHQTQAEPVGMAGRRDKKSRGARAPKAPLHPQDAQALNRAFYGADPGDYFSRRVRELLLLAGRTDSELRAETKTATYGKLELTVASETEDPDDPPDEDAHRRHVLLEAEMLVHHLGRDAAAPLHCARRPARRSVATDRRATNPRRVQAQAQQAPRYGHQRAAPG